MAHQNLNPNGIVTGQIVEAAEVLQLVSAFTKTPVNGSGYDITISGSLNLTGSLLMTGSLVNEFTGQFSALGLGVTAPTAPTMLHIKDTAAGGDPIVLLEGNAGGDNARIRFSNSDVTYDVGAYGGSGDDFILIQDAASSPLEPLRIDKDTISSTIYASVDSVGIGLGVNTPTILNPLNPGSLQALGRVSGSSMRAGTISASAAGINIHGTASYANYIETAVTASYVKSTDIDFYYSISQQINSTNTIAAVTGSFGAAKVSDLSGISIKDIGENGYSIFLSGSVVPDAGMLYLGDMTGEHLAFDQAEQQIRTQTDRFHIGNKLLVAGSMLVSGSSGAAAGRTIVVGPNGVSGASLPSASIFDDRIEFKQNSTAYISNVGLGASSNLSLSAGGGSSNVALSISASADITIPNGIVEFDNTDIGSTRLNVTGSLMKLSQGVSDDTNLLQQVTYRMAFKTQASNGGVGILFTIGTDNYPAPRIDLKSHSGGVIMYEMDLVASTTSNNDKGASWKVIATRKVDSNGSTGDIGANTYVHAVKSSGITVQNPTIDTSGATDITKVFVRSDSTYQLRYGGFIKATYIGYATDIS